MYKTSAFDPAAAANCAAILQTPGSVALVPTETVYGLVSRFDDSAAVAEIYKLKERDQGKPLALFVRNTDDIIMAGGIVDERSRKLITAFMPGPLTLILPGRSGVSVGVRMPAHPFIEELLKLLPFPLASTSANASGQPNALSCSEALAMLNGSPAAVIDAGPLPPDALASTIVDLRSPETFTILRPGPVSTEAVSAVLEME